ncbi:MAG: hypothetical protein AAB892_02285, partial [Patescibacteria group bacterium]
AIAQTNDIVPAVETEVVEEVVSETEEQVPTPSVDAAPVPPEESVVPPVEEEIVEETEEPVLERAAELVVEPAVVIDEGPQCVILSDTTTLEGGDASVEVSPLNAGWTAVVDVLAKWIWGENPIADPVNDVTEVFTKTFSITDDSSGGTLVIAADNSYAVTLDGNPIGSSNDEDNFHAGQEDTILISAAELGAGSHTLAFTVKNWAQVGGTPAKNPAGLKYKLTIDDTDCGTPPPPQCVPGDAWAYAVEDSDQGLRKNGSAVLPARSNPSAALGASDGSFFSLGFGGSIVIEFDSYIPDSAGDDLLVQEVTNGIYPSETATVTVSQDGSTWFPLTEQAGNGAGGSTSLDVSETGLPWFRYVKLTDTTNANLHQNDADGFDLDAIKGMNGVCEEPEEEVDQCVLVSDTTTLEGGTASALVTFIHNSWTALIQSASWIWGEDPATDTVIGKTETFTKTFWLDGAVASSTLLIAADNGYTVELNGVEIGADPQEKNYTAAGQDVITIPAGDFNVGANTLVFTVDNFPLANGTYQTNPGGLLYKLTIDGTECDDTPPEQEMLKVYILKYLETANGTEQIVDGSGAPAFPMTSSWDAANLGAGSGSYSLAAPTYGATTSAMTSPADYATEETTDGSVVLPADAQCTPGKYRLVGYKTGTTLLEAENDDVSTTAPSFTDITSDRYVIVVNEDCDDANEEPDPTTLQVHIYKHLQDEESTGQIVDNANVPDFPMTATWTTANLNGGATTSGAYVLGNNHGGATFQHAANTALMDAPADYTTSEVTDGSVVVANGERCVADKYRLVGYKWGTSYADAVATTTITVAAPEFTDLTSDRYVIVVNEDCDDVLDDGEPTEPDEQTIVITGNTSAGENQLGWMFNRDTTTQSPFAFLLGNASIGSGSLYVEPIVNDYDGSNGNCKGGVDQTGCDKFIGELFLQEQIADIDSISYDFKIAAPDATVEEHFYMSVYANFGESSPTKFYDCRYSIVPVTGSTGAFTTVTFDPTQSYPVTTRTGAPGVASPYPCPASPAGMDALSTGSSTVRVIALNVGDTSGSDTGVGGYLDKVVVALTDLITTYDFEPTPIAPDDDTVTIASSGGGGGGSSKKKAAGAVLGATTDAACSALLSTFMRMGIANDATEVLELQGFLNEHMAAGLPLTGFFGAMTDAAVHAFQKEHWEDVLKPWFPYPAEGIHDADDSTGYVYKTTQWKINDIYCPDIAPFPPLP